jgi:hypothetical protein
MTARAPRPPEQRKAARRRYYVAHRDEILDKRKAHPGYPAERAAWQAKRAEGRLAWNARRDAVYLDEFHRLRAINGHLDPAALERLRIWTNQQVGWTPKPNGVPLNGDRYLSTGVDVVPLTTASSPSMDLDPLVCSSDRYPLPEPETGQLDAVPPGDPSGLRDGPPGMQVDDEN